MQPYLLVDGVKLLLQHERESLSVRLAAGGEQSRADVVVHVRLGLDVTAKEVADTTTQRRVVLLKHRTHLNTYGSKYKQSQNKVKTKLHLAIYHEHSELLSLKAYM